MPVFPFFFFSFTILSTHSPAIHQCHDTIAEAFVGWSHDPFSLHTVLVRSKVDLAECHFQGSKQMIVMCCKVW